MLYKIKKYWLGLSLIGQNMTEYLVVFVGIVVTLVAVAGPTGIFTQRIEESLNTAVVGTKCLALAVCYDPNGCEDQEVCGNGCCEEHETMTSCPIDCDRCVNNQHCSDNIACNGLETCNPATGLCISGGINTCQSCGTVPAGECRLFYLVGTPAFGQSCSTAVEKCCNGDTGQFVGPASHPAMGCQPASGAPCLQAGLQHEQVGFVFENDAPPCDRPCSDYGAQRECYNGTVVYVGTTTPDPLTRYQNCTFSPCDGCLHPDPKYNCQGCTPRWLANLESGVFYPVEKEECWDLCSSNAVVRTCTEGSLSGASISPLPIYEDCEDTPPSSCDDELECTADGCDHGSTLNFGCTNIPDDAVCNTAPHGDGKSCTGVLDRNTLSSPRLNHAANGEDYCNPGNPSNFATGCRFDWQDDWCTDPYACTDNLCNPGHYRSDPTTGCWFQPDNDYCDTNINCSTDLCSPGYPGAWADGCVHIAVDHRCRGYRECADRVCDLSVCLGPPVVVPPPPEALPPPLPPPCDACVYTPNNANCDPTTPECGASPTCDGPTVRFPPFMCLYTPDDSLCTAGLECGIGTCEPDLSCTYTPDPANCPDDGIACTNEVCNTSFMCASVPDDTLCDDGVSCTSNHCDTWYDCVNTPDNTLCDDGVVCTDDFCTPGDPSGDCTYVPNDALCPDDGIFCNGQGICDPVNDCTAILPDCDDNVGCTVDSCNTSTDACESIEDDTFCDDSNHCTTDTCDPANGHPATGCLYGTVPNCCNNDSVCDAGEGCDGCPGDCGCDPALEFCDTNQSPAQCEPVCEIYNDEGDCCSAGCVWRDARGPLSPLPECYVTQGCTNIPANIGSTCNAGWDGCICKAGPAECWTTGCSGYSGRGNCCADYTCQWHGGVTPPPDCHPVSGFCVPYQNIAAINCRADPTRYVGACSSGAYECLFGDPACFPDCPPAGTLCSLYNFFHPYCSECCYRYTPTGSGGTGTCD